MSVIPTPILSLSNDDNLQMVDNDVEKSQGLGPVNNRRWVNKPEEHIELKSFKGESDDDELIGAGALALEAKLKALERARAKKH